MPVRRENPIMVRSPGMVILFDIDGTLIDHDAAEVTAVAALQGKIEHTEEAAGFLRRWRSAFERDYNRYLLVNYRSRSNDGSAFVKSLIRICPMPPLIR